MKTALIIDHDCRGAEEAVRLLRENGYSVEEASLGGVFPEGPVLETDHSYRKILEDAPIGVFRSTTDGKFISVNSATSRMLKYDSPVELMETVNQKGIAEVLYTEPGRRREIIEDIMSHEGWQVFEVRYRCKDGSIITCKDYIREVPGPDGVSELEGFVEDITERKKAEEDLRMIQFMVDNASIGISRGQEDGRILYANEHEARMLGYTREELCSLTYFDIVPDMGGRRWKDHRRLLRAQGSRKIEALHSRKDGTIFPVEVTINYMEFGDEPFSCSFTQDLSERKHAEAELRESEELLRVILENILDPVFITDDEGRFTFVCGNVPYVLGYTVAEIQAMGNIAKLFGKELFALDDLGTRGEIYNIDCVINKKDGTPHDYLITLKQVSIKNGTILYVCHDITERKQAEDRISAALAEKEMLLREVHHRVKNNMQIISTLLDLQSESIRDEEALKSFRDGKDRIKAMALIHERLYESTDMAFVNFQSYIEDLSAHLFDSYLVDPGRITLHVDAGGVTMGIDRAIPCGLIINELVTNSLKHAFPDNRRGEIRIEFHRKEDGMITLTVADNGVGVPTGLDFTRTWTLGLQLVNMLARQLRGEVTMEGEIGVICIVCFRDSGSR